MVLIFEGFGQALEQVVDQLVGLGHRVAWIVHETLLDDLPPGLEVNGHVLRDQRLVGRVAPIAGRGSGRQSSRRFRSHITFAPIRRTVAFAEVRCTVVADVRRTVPHVVVGLAIEGLAVGVGHAAVFVGLAERAVVWGGHACSLASVDCGRCRPLVCPLSASSASTRYR